MCVLRGCLVHLFTEYCKVHVLDHVLVQSVYVHVLMYVIVIHLFSDCIDPSLIPACRRTSLLRVRGLVHDQVLVHVIYMLLQLCGECGEIMFVVCLCLMQPSFKVNSTCSCPLCL